MSEPPASSRPPSRDGGVTADCPVCGRPLPPGSPRRWCSAACRQAAYRRRHYAVSAILPRPPVPPARSRREGTVYACPACDARYLGSQRCPECQVFCRRVGPGGRCPHCDEPVAVADLLEDGGGA